MRLDDFRNIDLNDISSWPVPVKIVAAVVIGSLIAFLGYWFWIKGDREELARVTQKEQELRQSYLTKKALAINLPAYEQQMQDMEESFGVMLRQLPNKTEIPELLIDITQAGLGRGLQFVLFKPGSTRFADFYATLPIDVTVTGSYHEMGQFVSDLAALPRIVSLGNFNIKPAAGGRLSMTTVALTYHYLDEEEIAAQAASKPAPANRTRR